MPRYFADDSLGVLTLAQLWAGVSLILGDLFLWPIDNAMLTVHHDGERYKIDTHK